MTYFNTYVQQRKCGQAVCMLGTDGSHNNEHCSHTYWQGFQLLKLAYSIETNEAYLITLSSKYSNRNSGQDYDILN
jgi:hypothetical protein